MGSAVIQGDLWGQKAREWAELVEPTHRPLWEAMLNAAQVGQRTRFLDVGCGGGGASVLAAGRGAQISGLDAAEPLIHIAKERVPVGDFHTGDMENLPFEDSSFDVVFAANSLQYAADRVAALREFKRVCGANGRCVVGLFSTPDKVDMRLFFKAIRESLTVPPPGDGPFGLSNPGKLEDLLTEAGWVIRGSDEVNCISTYENFEAFWKGHISGGGVQAALRTVGEAALKANAQRAVETVQREDGSIMMSNWFRYVIAGN
jgi:SAM-dependent methyltransferase